MSQRRGLISEISWFQVVASALAAVTAAWIASRLGVAGTLIGAALGSFVVTLSTAFYNRTLDHGRTLLIQTERGTMIERHVDEGEVSDAFNEASDVDSPVVGAQFVDEEPRLRWKSIIVTTLIVLGVALAGITTYEVIAKHPLGDSGGGTTIGDTFGSGPKDEPEEPDPADTATTPPPTTATTTPTAPTPTATTAPIPTDSPTPTIPTSPATEPGPG